VANRGGIVVLVNTTASGNHARRAGGGLANIGGQARVTNCTFSGNAAAEGASLHSSGELLVSNSILANSEKGDDCVAVRMDPKSGHNLIESGRGCGVPISTADPKLQEIGRYNGPTMTLPLLSGSEAINLGDNDAAVNEHGQPLVWDQRGPGDPRFVAGYTDIGAFEHQRLPVLEVDTVEESPLRGCTAGTVGDCPLRSAIELANEAREPAAITFDPRIFSEPVQLRLSRPLPRVTRELTIDASATPGVSVRCAEGVSIFLETDSEVQLQMFGLTIECPSDGALEAAEHVTNP
jgi:hypothetical protein